MSIELLAPAGSFETLRAAYLAGADAVYIGGKQFSARAYADNPEDRDLLEGIDLAHRWGKKVYLTVNTLLKEEELEKDLLSWLTPFYEAGLDAVIVQDLGVLSLLHQAFPELPLHASTQMAVTGPEGAKFLQDFGVARLIPARELSLKELRAIRQKTDIALEVFVHGALCYSVSGQCLASSILGGRSANRGRCAGVCRLPFSLERTEQLSDQHRSGYLLNMKDLCAAETLPDLIEAGISSLKIEGRMKQTAYVAGVTSVYRQILDRIQEDPSAAPLLPEETDFLRALFHRDGFTNGYLQAQIDASMVALANDRSDRRRTAETATRQVQAILQQAEQEGKADRRVTGTLRLRKGEPAVYTLRLQENEGEPLSCTVQAGEVISARTQPLSKERIAQQMRKGKRRGYCLEELQIDADADIFLPIQTLNQLRRDALTKLDEHLLQRFRRTDRPRIPSELSLSSTDAPKIPVLFAQGMTREQAEILCSVTAIQGLYLPLSLFALAPQIRDRGKNVYLTLPYLLRGGESFVYEEIETALQRFSWDGILVRNLEEWAFLRHLEHSGGVHLPTIVSDGMLYTMQDRAMQFCHERGIDRCTLPYELSFSELRQRHTAGSEIVVYGRTPLMLSYQCVKRSAGACNKQTGFVALRDRKQVSFPYWTDCASCQSTLYNSVPTDLSGEGKSLRHLRCAVWRLSFTTESPQEAKQIADSFGKLLSETTSVQQYPQEITKGHFRRGVL